MIIFLQNTLAQGKTMGALLAKLSAPDTPPQMWETTGFWVRIALLLALSYVIYKAKKSSRSPSF